MSTFKTIYPCAVWQRVNDIESDIIIGHAKALREMHPDDTDLHDLWFEIRRMRYMSLDAFISEDDFRRDYNGPCWGGLLIQINDAMDEFDPIKPDPIKPDPTPAYYEVEVEYYLKTKVVVRVDEIDPDLHASDDVAAYDAYGDKIDDAMEDVRRTLNAVCDEEVYIESTDVGIERLKNCPACNGTAADDICLRNPCLSCDGEGWEAK